MSLLLLEGRHVLNHTLIVSDTKHLLVAGLSNNQLFVNTTIVSCNECALIFKNITFLSLQNFELNGCNFTATSLSSETNATVVINCLFIRYSVIKFLNVNTMIIEHSKFINNSGTVFINFEYNLSIINCVFSGHRQIDVTDLPLTEITTLAESSFILFTNVTVFNNHPQSTWNPVFKILNVNTIFFEHCKFINNSHNAVEIIIPIQFNFNFTLTIMDCVFRGNEKALRLQGIYYSTLQSTAQTTCSVFNQTAILLRNVTIVNNHPSYSTQPVIEIVNVNTMILEHCKFIKNGGTAVKINTPKYTNFQLNVAFVNCVFSGNEHTLNLENVYDRSLTGIDIVTTLLTSIIFTNVTVVNNHPYSGPVIEVVNVKRMVIEDCRFMNNSGTVLAAYHSDITLSERILFSNNTGVRGGALALYNSYILLSEGVTAIFRGNYAADIGGAIYVNLFQKVLTFLCFYMLYTPLDTPGAFTKRTRDVWFENNSAVNGGDDIYGGTLFGSCELLLNSGQVSQTYYLQLFHFSDTATLSSITSDPTRVCLCDDQGSPQCANMEYIYRKLSPRYPGEVFTVPAVVVGYDFGIVPGIVYSELFKNTGNSSIGNNQRVQEIANHRDCTKLNFSIETIQTGTLHAIQMSVSHHKTNIDKTYSVYTTDLEVPQYKGHEMITDELLNHIVLIIIPLEDCPTGFILTTRPSHICTCHPTLEDNGITVCIITNHTGWVYRSGTVWVSDSFSGNQTNSFVVHQYCPYDYCKAENISVDLLFPDSQCAYDHSGVLCGGCYGNLTLALGTPRCIPCNNRYLSLLIVFIFTGFALVFFIKVLDLTVANGTINGLIFYANIVWANKSILFPTTETLHPFQQFLYTFIAWLNLDLGIETCFIDGLNAYWKTWLQFVFPLYVWFITGVVIIASHYSTRASKIFGNNSVPVLATLILLSYVKLLRTIIICLGFSLLNYPQGTRIVWSFDGNVPYFGTAHTILFLVALAALLLLWLPYTTVLLTLQWLRRKSYLKTLRWINTWKPFFDASFGQLKPKHHYWFGLLLLSRVALLVLFAATSATVPKLNIIAMAIVGLLLLVKQIYTGSVYKTLHLSILENSFIVNITVLGMAKLYMLPQDPANTPVIYTSIGILFVEFLAIVIYHIWCRLKSTYLTYKRRHRREDMPPERQLRVEATVPQDHMHYREPLLDSSVQDKS